MRPALSVHLLLLSVLCLSARADELRGFWVDAFHSGMKSAAQVTQLVADARAANVNALFVQVRKRGDAYYNSTLEPKATDVSPQSFDPLADLLAKAASGGPRIEVHAWIVTYNIWNGQNSSPAQSSHPYNSHPDWLTERADGVKWDGANYGFDPAHPAVQAHTLAVCQDILSRYAVDGLHLDYIRYTDGDSSVGHQPWGYHPVAVQRFQSLTGRTDRPPPGDAQWLQFRRDQVTALVRKIYLHGWKTRRSARISAALICYGSAPSATLSSWQARDAYGRVLQDWRSWMEEGILDLAIPMIYRDHSVAARKTEFDAWCAWTRDRQFSRAGAAGTGSYLNAPAGSLAQIKQSRIAGTGGTALGGVIGYSYAVPASGSTTRAQYLAMLTNDAAAEAVDPGGTPVFAEPAAVPAMPWKSSAVYGHLMGTLSLAAGGVADGAAVSLTGPVSRTLKTDATGFFGSVDLPAGTYTLSVSVPGFLPVVRTVTITGSLVTEVPAVLHAVSELPFEITAHSWNPALRRITLTWNSVPGKSYRTELSGSLQTWTPLAAGIQADGSSTTWTSASLPSAARRFFRVVEE